MSTKSLGVVIIAPEIIDYYYPYKYLVDGFFMTTSDNFFSLNMGQFEPFCLVSKIVPLIFPGLYHLTDYQTVDKTKAPTNG
jgi:hypothetical protein